MIVRCRGCRRAIGVAGDEHFSIFCSERCAEEGFVGFNEERDALISALSLAGWPNKALAELFDVSRQRVIQICQQQRLSA